MSQSSNADQYKHIHGKYEGEGNLHCPDDYIEEPIYKAPPTKATATPERDSKRRNPEIDKNAIGMKICGQAVLNKIVAIKSNGSSTKMLRCYNQSASPTPRGRYSSMLSVSSSQKAHGSDIPLLSMSTSSATRSSSSRSALDDESSASSLSFLLPSRKAKMNKFQNNEQKPVQTTDADMNHDYRQIISALSPDCDSRDGVRMLTIDSRVDVHSTTPTSRQSSIDNSASNISLDQMKTMLALQYPGSPDSSSTVSTNDFSVPRVVLQFDPNGQYQCIPVEIDDDANNRSIYTQSGDQSEKQKDSSGTNSIGGTNSSTSGSQGVALDSMSSKTPKTTNKAAPAGIESAARENQNIQINKKQEVSEEQHENQLQQYQDQLQPQPQPPSQRKAQVQEQNKQPPAPQVFAEGKLPESTQTQIEEDQTQQNATALTSFFSSFRAQPWTLTLPSVVEEEEDEVNAMTTPLSVGVSHGSANVISDVKAPSDRKPQLSPSSSPLSNGSSQSSLDNNTARIEILAAMKDLVTKQQEAILDLTHENTLFRQQLQSYENNINLLNNDKRTISNDIVSLMSQKDIYEKQVLHLKDEILELRKFVLEMNTSNNINTLQKPEKPEQATEMVTLSPTNESVGSRSMSVSSTSSQPQTGRSTDEQTLKQKGLVTGEITTKLDVSRMHLTTKPDEHKKVTIPFAENHDSNKSDFHQLPHTISGYQSTGRDLDLDDASSQSSIPAKISEKLLQLAYETSSANASMSSKSGTSHSINILRDTVAGLRHDFQSHKTDVHHSIFRQPSKDISELGQEVLLHSPSCDSRYSRNVLSQRSDAIKDALENDENKNIFDDNLSFFEGTTYEIFKSTMGNVSAVSGVSSLTSRSTSSSQVVDGNTDGLNSVTNSSNESVLDDRTQYLKDDADTVLSPDSRTTAQEIANFKSRLGSIQHRRFTRQQLLSSSNDSSKRKKKVKNET